MPQIKNVRRLRTHRVSGVAENSNANIVVDTTIKTDIIISHNRPDIVVFDKKANKMTLIEVGIISQENHQAMELTKYRKYDTLAKELVRIHTWMWGEGNPPCGDLRRDCYQV